MGVPQDLGSRGAAPVVTRRPLLTAILQAAAVTMALAAVPLLATAADGANAPPSTRAVTDFSDCGQTGWPAGALRKGERGKTRVAFYVAADGKVVDAMLLQSSGFGSLDDATTASLLSCKYKPAQQNGQAAGSWAAVEFDWFNYSWTDPVLQQSGQKARSGASLGDPQQQYNLANKLAAGIGMDEDRATALRWYHAAADQGNIDAQVKLGELYKGGVLVGADDAQAATWYGKAAELGSDVAQQRLARLLLAGRGVAVDKDKARHWLLLAAGHAYAPAQTDLGDLYAAGNGIERDDGAARSWYLRAASQGDADAEQALGAMAETGRGAPADPAAAVTWYKKAALGGNIAAIGKMATLFEQGGAVAQNLKFALIMYLRAANGGDRAALRRVIAVYEQGGLGERADPVLAEQWRTRLARLPEGVDLQRL